jgi:hypothetical protein
MAKTLKIWNGRGHGLKYGKYHVYVAAYTQKQAAELLSKALNSNIDTNEIRVYYSSGCWGNSMVGIEATEPCVYVDHYIEQKIPIRIL